jgi:phosphatidylglycerophosphate synthase
MRSGPVDFFRQTLKSDAFYADELINIVLLRPVAAAIVWILTPTPVTPNQVTVFAVLLGFGAAAAYLFATPAACAVAGALVLAKDIFDDADGQLARAKNLYSRRGRFLDSIGDFAVNLAVFPALTSVVYTARPHASTVVLGVLALAGITLRVSYHVYYQVSFLHLENRYALNRISEEITESDRRGDPVAFRLQQIFVWIYGWQDRLMYRLDQWCKMGDGADAQRWYADRVGLRLSGLLGFGTELSVLAVCSWTGGLYAYLWINVALMNAVLFVNVLYRRVFLAPRVR